MAPDQENPWDFVQSAFRRLADPDMDSVSPLSLDALMGGRPALLDKVPSTIHTVLYVQTAIYIMLPARQAILLNIRVSLP